MPFKVQSHFFRLGMLRGISRLLSLFRVFMEKETPEFDKIGSFFG